MNRQPLVGICGAFALGILLDYSINIPVPFLVILTSIPLLTFPVLLYLRPPLRYCVITGLILVCMTGASFHHYRHCHFPIDHISRYVTTEKTPARLRGIVVSSLTTKRLKRRYYSQSAERMSFLLKAEGIENRGGWDKVSGTIRVSLYANGSLEGGEGPEPQINYGDEIELLGTIVAPTPPGSPGQFDYKGYLQRLRPRITATMVVVNPSNIKVVSRDNGNAFFAFVHFVKKRLGVTINRCCSSKSSSIITAMALGHRENIPDDVMDAFKKSGTMHFLAISGFHVGILAVTVHTILRLLHINRRLSAGLMVFFLASYAVLTGMVPSAVRACLMASIYFGAIPLNRKRVLLNSIAAAVLIILIINPSELFRAGLQLSVLGVLGIVYVTKRIEGTVWKGTLLVERLQAPEERSRFRFLWRYVRKTLCMSLGAWLAVMPLVAHNFHIVTPFAPLLNVIIFPLIFILVIGGLVISILGSVHPVLAIPFGHIIHHANHILEWLVSCFTSKQLTFFYTPGPSWLWISIYYTMGIILIYHKEMRLRLAHAIILILVCGNVFFYWNALGHGNKELRLTCLSVGHGSAIFVEFPNGKNLLYDAGSYGRFDVGEFIIAPFLWERGVRTIDLVVLSHEDSDHVNGLPLLIERFRIDTIMTNKPFLHESGADLYPNKANQSHKSVLKRLRDSGIKHVTASSGTRIEGFGTVGLTVLGPPEECPLLSRNDNSCVLRIAFAGKTILLLGDIEEAGITSLLNNCDNLEADIIQVPHHGYPNANTGKLVQRVQPRYAFINSGPRTVSDKTLNEYLKNGAQVLQTHQSGAITITINSQGVIKASTFTTPHPPQEGRAVNIS